MGQQRILGELTKRTRHDGATYFDGTINGHRVSLFRGRTRSDGREVWNLAVEEDDYPPPPAAKRSQRAVSDDGA